MPNFKNIFVTNLAKFCNRTHQSRKISKYSLYGRSPHSHASLTIGYKAPCTNLTLFALVAEGLAMRVDDLALLLRQVAAWLALDAFSFPIDHLAQRHHLLPIAVVPIALAFQQMVVLVALHTFPREVSLSTEGVDFHAISEGKNVPIVTLKTFSCVIVVAFAFVLHRAASAIGKVVAVHTADAVVSIESQTVCFLLLSLFSIKTHIVRYFCLPIGHSFFLFFVNCSRTTFYNLFFLFCTILERSD